jgi:hypothetical protein
VLKSETGNVALRQTANETPAAVISNPVDDDEDEIDEVLIRKKRPEEEMDMTPMQIFASIVARSFD